ncbi:CDP-diacylglycerol--glycerol-3-phosphate 3-phosphatidyltransferase [Pseudooceanicola nitratireducens]|uniref:CDP-diacylglycerol--glycerol-3-phosphate 3-phosphatidyltransferase n=1 Tax=Pseudooceanicola nitratireducens TaxID=517719 RepID=UPI001C938BFE|nr:CDP-diacylglycerol--glycerol-3-phosphate 3-phosphatidyltransferase [Pseudooceanicola nitratireducens]MBY6158304.1 CDP-diacylglycerol--glycerol-3-phosphate 3-phosphatidyltransferase [Pseudooceanicola nitratireducens]MBY6165084.1 CDP-diacylglycerol--glycerol-3-phosphate 3-phosphatidyltransferase [Pseudooceanicola nitratireducens]
MRMTLPNILTLVRLLAAPGIILVFLLIPRPYADWLAFGLFVGASVTDYIDGYLARKWNQISRIGTMLDPIADKAMVALALLALAVWSPLKVAVILPGAVILFREVFVSGLREFLGDVAGTLKVTKLAKWKTAVQMIAIALLLAQGGLNTTLGMAVFGMDAPMITAILDGSEEDPLGIRGMLVRAEWAGYIGLILIWLAAGLTAITGWDYFSKARAHLGED